MHAKILHIVEGYEGIMESMRGLINPNAYESIAGQGAKSITDSPFFSRPGKQELPDNLF
jgi:hypothetical protein